MTSPILDLVSAHAHSIPDARAIAAPERIDLSYSGLNERLESIERALREGGVGPRDCVAFVLRNGPEAAVAFLGVSSAAVCAPLNPAYQERELEFYLTDLDVRAVIVDATSEPRVAPVAERLGIRRVQLTPIAGAPAGAFDLAWIGKGEERSARRFELPEGTALVLHTSGTTGRPKITPISGKSLSASARNIERALSLTARDRCLDVMPLFHIHGLVGGLLSSIAAGASVVCPPPFDPLAFLSWMTASRPTWYTAVPTMHHAIMSALASAGGHSERPALRLIRSSSARLPPRLMSDLEAGFGAPVIEAYGMTEAAHQIASNPLPPRARKSGSVGLPSGVEVAVLLSSGSFAGAGQPGEIVIRGPTVMSGYANNPQANTSAFFEGWFRTGDQGYLDDDGYLFLTGRIKEIINRGGEKVAPVEIDEVLTEHPSVAEAATFGTSHATLGEDVAAAVVMKKGADVGIGELRRHLAARLSAFKIPSRIVLVERIPKGPTGKLQRSTLAKELAPLLATAFAAPKTEMEHALASIWGRLLSLDRVSVLDNFYALGGDSLVAVQMVAEAKRSGIAITATELERAPTIAELAEIARPLAASERDQVEAPGPVRLTYDLRYVLDRLSAGATHRLFAGEILRFDADPPLTEESTRRALSSLMQHHDGLRVRFEKSDRGSSSARVLALDDVSLVCLDFAARPESERDALLKQAIKEHLVLPVFQGPQHRAVLCRFGADRPSSLLVALSHLFADLYSLRVFTQDLMSSLAQARTGGRIVLPERSTSYAGWAREMERFAERADPEAVRYWTSVADRWEDTPPLVTEHPHGERIRPRLVGIPFSKDKTLALFAACRAHGASLHDLVLAASLSSLARWGGKSSFRSWVLDSGRARVPSDACDLSRTMGPFMSSVPLVLEMDKNLGIFDALRSIREQTTEGIERFLLLRALRERPADDPIWSKLSVFHTRGRFELNYMGSGLPGEHRSGDLSFRVMDRAMAPLFSEAIEIEPATLLMRALITDGRLDLSWWCEEGLYRERTILALNRTIQELLDSACGSV
jgi:acyl-CoA synthetase (AMP-forming)/AMP-acid ligase II